MCLGQTFLGFHLFCATFQIYKLCPLVSFLLFPPVDWLFTCEDALYSSESFHMDLMQVKRTSATEIHGWTFPLCHVNGVNMFFPLPYGNKGCGVTLRKASVGRLNTTTLLFQLQCSCVLHRSNQNLFYRGKVTSVSHKLFLEIKNPQASTDLLDMVIGLWTVDPRCFLVFLLLF